MPNVTLAKPRTVSGAIITGSGIGTAYGTDTFVLKVQRGRIRTSTPWEETTGDGDASGPVIENSQDMYGAFRLEGFMVGAGVGDDHALGIINLKDQSTPVELGIVFSSGEFFPRDGGNDLPVLVTDVIIDWTARGPHIGVAILMQATDGAFVDATRDIGDT